jgi:hypothetical protein
MRLDVPAKAMIQKLRTATKPSATKVKADRTSVENDLQSELISHVGFKRIIIVIVGGGHRDAQERHERQKA